MRYGPFLSVILIAGTAVGAYYWLQDVHSLSGPGARGDGRRGAQRDGPVPVTVATVQKDTVPVYREGIGNVQALYTVTVRAQVDGRLMSVDFTEGQEVRKGDVLARIDPTTFKAQYDQAVAKRAQDQATLANARIDLQRYRKLAQTNAGPQQQADQQAALVAQLEAQVQSDEAAIDNAKAYLDYTVISSPIDGRIGLRLIDPGNIVHVADANGLVSITQVRPIAVIFTLPQRDLPVVSAALTRGNVKVEVLSAEGRDAAASGRLQTIDNQIDMTTGTIKLKAVFENADQKLWPGQFVSTRVVIDTLTNARVIPAVAVRRGPNGTFVYVVGSDEKASVRPVTVLLQDETRAVIGQEVEFGTQIVTVGFAQLADNKPVRIVAGDQPAPAPGSVTNSSTSEPRQKRESSGKRDGTGGQQRRRREEKGASHDPAHKPGTREAQK
jgi:multidrug efflux system membrane fusion protein